MLKPVKILKSIRFRLSCCQLILIFLTFHLFIFSPAFFHKTKSIVKKDIISLLLVE